jgi:hypothetical protein
MIRNLIKARHAIILHFVTTRAMINKVITEADERRASNTHAWPSLVVVSTSEEDSITRKRTITTAAVLVPTIVATSTTT